VADSEVFSDEMKDIILSENSLNVATPVASEPEPHTHYVEELYCVFPETCFCARRPQSNNLFFLRSASRLLQLFIAQHLR